ncbi:hypothetical protein EBZ38_03415 [bacterium]|nr:hypothetical protein [bacterium]NDC94011.1 hypothetical protein [bacterium]NDD83316.1 hypothetical protein [bacterium]
MSDGMSEAFGTRNRLQKQKQKKYILFYVQDQTPKVKKFATIAQAKKYAKQIELLNNPMESWVDCIVKGEIIK